jgi:hypothetical protein
MDVKRRLLSLLLVGLIAGCKLTVHSPRSGHVVTESGTFNCPAGQTCSLDITDIFFDETFVAVSDFADYKFVGWRARNAYFCGGSLKPCRLFTAGFEGNDDLLALLESDWEFFLEPVFERSDVARLEYRESSLPKVEDANGRAIGSLREGYRSLYTDWDIVVNFEGIPADYIFRVVQQRDFGAAVTLIGAGDAWYDNDQCKGTPEPLGHLPYNATEVWRNPVIAVSRSETYIALPSAKPEEVIIRSGWYPFINDCYRLPPGEEIGPAFLTRLHPTDFSVEFPLTVEVEGRQYIFHELTDYFQPD